MAEPTALSLSRFFSDLTGREVSFSLAVNPPAPKKIMFGSYTIEPEGDPLLVKISLTTLSLLGGALLGLPEESALERAAEIPFNEPLRDAMHEILNIASTAISDDRRVVFKKMARDLASLPEVAHLDESFTRRSAFRIAVDGSQPESFVFLQ